MNNEIFNDTSNLNIEDLDFKSSILESSEEQEEKDISYDLLKKYEDIQTNIDSIKAKILAFKQEHPDIFDVLSNYESEISKLADSQDALKKDLCTQMEKENKTTVSGLHFKATYYKATVSHKLMDSFKVDHPDLYDKYTTKTNKSSYVKISEVKGRV